MMRALLASFLIGLFVTYGFAAEKRPIGQWNTESEHEQYVRFQADGSVTGNSGCNRFFGAYEIVSDIIRVGALASTKRACPDQIMQSENAFLDALKKSEKFKIVSGTNQLVLFGADGSKVLALSPSESD